MRHMPDVTTATVWQYSVPSVRGSSTLYVITSVVQLSVTRGIFTQTKIRILRILFHTIEKVHCVKN